MTRKIGVVGAGTMGQGIANAFASAGNECNSSVTLKKNGQKTVLLKSAPAKIN